MHDDRQPAQQSGLPIATPPALDPATKRAPKFRNTDNPAQTWVGRGKRPNWLKAKLLAGARLDDFRVRDQPHATDESDVGQGDTTFAPHR